MGSHSTHGKKEVKKPKSGGSSANQGSFSTRPVFVPPVQIKKEKRER